MLSVICIIEKALTSNIGSLVYCLPNLSTPTLHTLNLLRSSKKLIRVHNPIILLSMKYVNQLHYPPRHSIKSYTNLLNENGNNYSWKKKPVVEAIDKALIISSFALSYNWSIWCNKQQKNVKRVEGVRYANLQQPYQTPFLQMQKPHQRNHQQYSLATAEEPAWLMNFFLALAKSHYACSCVHSLRFHSLTCSTMHNK